MSYSQDCIRFSVIASLLCAGLTALSANAANLTVGPTPANTYANLETAFAAAVAGDTLVLDEAGSPYVLTQEMVVTAGKSPLRIQGQFSNNEVPADIVIQGAAGSPAITVEQDAELTLRHLTVKGGTTGIQVLKDARATLQRVYVSETGAEGMSVTEAEFVKITSSIFNACGAEGIVVNSGTVDVAQSTFIDNVDVAIDLQGGTCEVGASYFYNNNGGTGTDQLTASVSGLSIDYCGVVQGNVGTSVVETNDVEAQPGFTPAMAAAFADPDNLLFDPASTWRGQVLLPVTTGVASTAINTDAPFGRDFLYQSRSTTDVQVGAHEFAAILVGTTWVNCIVSQYNNPTAGLVGLGRVDIEVEVSLGTLVGATLYLVPEPPRGDVTSNNMFIPIPVDSTTQNSNYGVASLTLSDSFMTTPGGASLLLDGRAELYLQLPGSPTFVFPDPGALAEFGTGYNDAFIEIEAQTGRFFVIDTLPPIVTGFRVNRAHDYVIGHNDILAPGIPDGTGGVLSVPWSAAINAPLASSTGVLDGEFGSADPHLFFNERTGLLDFSIRMEFTDSNALIIDSNPPILISENGGFQTAPPAQTATGLAIRPLLQNPADLGLRSAGLAWWDEVKGLPLDAGTSLTITYTGGGKDVGGNSQPLAVIWAFTGVPTSFVGGFGFWEAVAQFGVEDLVGNQSGAAIGNDPYRYALNPFHIWELYDVAGTLKGPGYSETTSPVINWGVQRFQGVSPQDTSNAYPLCQYAVYYHPTSTNPNDVGWELADAVNGIEWSDWIASRRIDKYTRFRASTNTVLGDIIQRQGMYMIVVRTADEAGNVVSVAGYPGLAGLNFSAIAAPLVADTWINGGPSISLDTRVTPTFWHNRPGANARVPDRGEKVFGSATQIPLPGLEFCERVEAGFTITMDLPDAVSPAAARVLFELYEDGRLAAKGEIAGVPGSSDVTLVIPEDLLNPPANLLVQPVSTVPLVSSLAFLNDSECGTRDRLGDDGLLSAEPAPRQRNVKYQFVASTALSATEFDPTPATVEFTVTVDRGLKDEQPVKSFSKE